MTELERLEMPETDYPPLAPLSTGTHPADPLVVAINRLAAAVEEANRNRGHLAAPEPGAALRAAFPELAPLPAVNPQRPACPKHGPDKIAPSTKKGIAFYCQAKDSTTRNGFCSFTVAA